MKRRTEEKETDWMFRKKKKEKKKTFFLNKSCEQKYVNMICF